MASIRKTEITDKRRLLKE